MVELGYRYSKLDKTHEYSVVAGEDGTKINYWNQWLWHWLKFKHTKNVRLKYHANCNYPMKILASYRGANAKTVANLISKKIEKHRISKRRTANVQKKISKE